MLRNSDLENLSSDAVPLLSDGRTVIGVVKGGEVANDLLLVDSWEGDVRFDEVVGFGCDDFEILVRVGEGNDGFVVEIFEGLQRGVSENEGQEMRTSSRRSGSFRRSCRVLDPSAER